MTRMQRLIFGCTALVCAGMTLSSADMTAQQPPARPPLVDANNKRLQHDPSMQTTTVFGDPNKPGMYIIRNRFNKGNGSRPHFHDQDRWVTVIQGTWWTDEGDVYRPDRMVPIKVGGLMYHPAGFHHYDGAKDEDVIVQIMGMGPVKTIQTEVNDKGEPVGANPAAPRR